ncbi:DUF1080 domain-containing protein [Candidatus Poribacteria bacterium]|nr:DUF1080 domain-containing protein [Candidatus Poribacteria bacterium]MYK93891.1 DUF1080 domain-containing protein [Candidatus Poribacteria bacterium]
MRYSNVVTVIFMVAILTPIASAGIWQENFDKGLPDGWNEVKGEWKIVKDAYAETSGGQYAKTMFGDEDWTDYTLEVDVTLVENVNVNAAGVLIRADTDGNNGMRFWIRTDQHKCQFSRWRENQFEHIVTPLPVEPEVGETYRLKVIAEGQNYQCFVDDELLFEGDDDAKFRDSGRIGFITYEANVHFDNLVIDGADIPSFAVEPNGKLTTRWGQLKTAAQIQ